MQVEEKVGTRDFSAVLELNGIVTMREGELEKTRLSLNDALVTLTQERNGEGLLQATLGDARHASLRQYAPDRLMPGR